jgi:cytochrome P450
MSKRIAADTDRKDFAFYALQIQKMGDPKSLISDGELAGSFQVLMVAGSETSATALSACM